MNGPQVSSEESNYEEAIEPPKRRKLQSSDEFLNLKSSMKTIQRPASTSCTWTPWIRYVLSQLTYVIRTLTSVFRGSRSGCIMSILKFDHGMFLVWWTVGMNKFRNKMPFLLTRRHFSRFFAAIRDSEIYRISINNVRGH